MRSIFWSNPQIRLIVKFGLFLFGILILFCVWHDLHYNCVLGHFEEGITIHDRIMNEKRFVCDCWEKK